MSWNHIGGRNNEYFFFMTINAAIPAVTHTLHQLQMRKKFLLPLTLWATFPATLWMTVTFGKRTDSFCEFIFHWTQLWACEARRRSSAAPPLFTGRCSLLSLFGLQRAAPDLSSKPTGRLAEARCVQGPACNWSLPWNAGRHAESLTPARERRRRRGTGVAGPPSLCDLIYSTVKIVHLGGFSENPLPRLWRQKLRFLSKQRFLLPKGTLCVYCGHMTEEAQS